MRQRFGVVGCGMIGRWHARILAEHPAASLAAVCDVDPERARAVADPLDCRVYSDLGAMLAAERLAGLIVATPEAAHPDDVALAARASCAVLIEKPAAVDIAGVERMIADTRAAGVLAMVGHVERFETGSAHLRDAVAGGLCGQVVSILARRQFSPGDTPRFAGRSTTLRLLGIHDFDLVRWIHPAPVVEVYAAAGRGRVHAETGLDDHVVTTIRFADGALAAVESAWTLPPAYAGFSAPAGWAPAGNNRLDVFGDRGFVSNDMSLRGQQLVAFDAAEGFRAAGLRHQPVVHGRVEGALRAEVAHFVDCLSRGTAPLVGLDDARRAVALCEAAEESLASGRPVARIAA